MTTTRQLAAIMFADIDGYTSIMQDDEALALHLLDKFRNQLESTVALHKGRILEIRGDGAMCSFNSTLEGVRAALALQLEMQQDPKVPLRIGMHTGDVIISGNSIYGDGVNIASRVESFAIPGSILMSGKAHDDIKNQRDLPTLFLGNFALKNVKDQIAIYAISQAGIILPEVSSMKGKGAVCKQKCVLVLPFVNIIKDAGQDYFSDGLTEELISNLNRLSGIRVISRTTSMSYKDTIKDLKTIGLETGASYIMEGSVRQHGNNLRISAQFIDALEDSPLWADIFQGTIEDIFDIQQKVSSKIVEALRIKLTNDDIDSLQKRFTDSTEAYQLYLQGRYFWNKRTEVGLQTAIRYFENAIQIDPNYALAWAGIADAFNLMIEYTTYSRKELTPKAKAAVTRALELDPQLAEAHISLAFILMLSEWDWDKSGSEFRIGMELNSNYATGPHWYAEWLLFNGRVTEALQKIALAVELDPVSKAILKDQGMAYYYARQYDKALENTRKVLELDPDFISVFRLRSLVLTEQGLYDEALSENEHWGKLTANALKTKLARGYILATSGKHQEALSIAEEIQQNEKFGSNDYRSMALIYTAMRHHDNAFHWLELSYLHREESLCSLKVDPKLDRLREDPRFNDLIRKIGLA